MNVTFDLTEIEKRVLTLVARGYRIKDITSELNISASYTYHITTKLKCRFNSKTWAGVAGYAMAHGIINLDRPKP